jgi:hypothetical protein
MTAARLRSWFPLSRARLWVLRLCRAVWLGGAPPDALALEIGEKLTLPLVVLHGEEYEACDGNKGHGIGRPDERSVGTEIWHGVGGQASGCRGALEMHLAKRVHAAAQNLSTHGDEM